MKKQTNKIKGIVIALLAVITLSFTGKAQCGNGTIANNLTCSIDVAIRVFNCTGGLCTSYAATIPPTTTINVACPCTACNVQVTVTDVGGTSTFTSPFFRADFTTTIPVNWNVGNGCVGIANMVYTTGVGFSIY